MPGSLFNYTNELEVEIDFSDVDPNLLKRKKAQSQSGQPASNPLLSAGSSQDSSTDSDSDNTSKKPNPSEPEKEEAPKRSRLRPGLFGGKKGPRNKKTN